MNLTRFYLNKILKCLQKQFRSTIVPTEIHFSNIRNKYLNTIGNQTLNLHFVIFLNGVVLLVCLSWIQQEQVYIYDSQLIPAISPRQRETFMSVASFYFLTRPASLSLAVNEMSPVSCSCTPWMDSTRPSSRQHAASRLDDVILASCLLLDSDLVAVRDVSWWKGRACTLSLRNWWLESGISFQPACLADRLRAFMLDEYWQIKQYKRLLGISPSNTPIFQYIQKFLDINEKKRWCTIVESCNSWKT